MTLIRSSVWSDQMTNDNLRWKMIFIHFSAEAQETTEKGFGFNFQELKPNTFFYFSSLNQKVHCKRFFSAEIRNKCGFFLQVEQNFYFSRKLHKSEKNDLAKAPSSSTWNMSGWTSQERKNSLKLVHSSTGYQIKFASHRFYF